MPTTTHPARSTSRRLLAGLAGAVLLVVATSCSSDGSDGDGGRDGGSPGATTTTVEATTTTEADTGSTTTAPGTEGDVGEGSAAGIVNELVTTLADGGLGDDRASCVGDVMTSVIEASGEQGTTQVLAAEQLAAYEQQCGVTADDLAGAVLGGTAAAANATDEEVACVAAAGRELGAEALTVSDPTALDDIFTNCGIVGR